MLFISLFRVIATVSFSQFFEKFFLVAFKFSLNFLEVFICRKCFRFYSTLD